MKRKTNIHFKLSKKLYKSHKMNKNHLFIKNYEYFFKKVLTKGYSGAIITTVQRTQTKIV